MKAKALLLGAVCALSLAAPAQSGLIFDTSSGLGLEADGIPFLNGLYAGYVDLSKDRSASFDPVDGEHFNHKARTAARRAPVHPDWVIDRELLPEDAAELAAAHERLRTSFDRGARFSAPADSAEAQVSYDCWLEAAERVKSAVGYPSKERKSDLERCRERFNAAIARAEALSDAKLTELRKEAPKMAAAPTPGPAPKRFLVYFAFDSSVITSAGERVIEEAVAAAEKVGIVDFSITGHADRAGPEPYNLDLSLRRANAVRDALIARGVKSTGISVAGRGEAEPAVPTADGVREPANRRVEIILL